MRGVKERHYSPGHSQSQAVVVNVWKESYLQVEVCLRKISEHFPTSAKTIILNGVERPEVTMLASTLDWNVEAAPNYATRTTWHLWWLRMLHLFCEVGCDVCFKFDPDTMVDARPHTIPSDDYFGDVQLGPLGFFVQGGITGLSGAAAHRLLESKLLESGATGGWLDSLPRSISFAEDLLIARAFLEIDVVPKTWPECRSRWKIPFLNDPVTYAIIHPRFAYSEDDC